MFKAFRKVFSIKICWLAWLVILVGGGSAVGAEPYQGLATVYVVGTSVRGADMAASRNEAIADSLVVAVNQVLGDMMPPETIEGNFQVLSERILSNTDQFIKDYKILTEATHGTTHRVLVRATVSIVRLKSALKQAGVYLGARQLPAVLFCIAEKQVGSMGYFYWWSGQPEAHSGAADRILAQIAGDKGFAVVKPRMETAMAAYPPELSVPEAVALAQQMQAEVVVVGQAVAEESTSTAGAALKSFRGTVAARAYSVRNGQEIGRAEHTATVNGEDPTLSGRKAVNEAARTAGQDLVTQMAGAWFSAGMGNSKIEIAVEGVSGHIADFVKFRGALSTMSGVDDVQRQEMQADRAVLLVDYQGGVRALTDALVRQNFDTFGLDIAEPVGNTIRLKIVPR